ncbi:MAG: hypothetical protein A2939_03840 [Parcubacteria group bacterium RIFCSPLOWO2_01_FULL_48_18]|nr:MAG: hypothetical protein A2939_03840 [Parcubacteria group bacterium RIFCSPLOWO2_01_FULL_48_18]
MKESSPVIDAIKKVMPAVVSIVVTKTLEEVEKEVPAELLPYLPHQGGKLQVPEEEVEADGRVRVGGGSGFVVDKDGIILTNKHVVSEGKAEYTVLLDTGEKYPAQILARDPINDVAIIKIAAEHLPVIELGNSSDLELGQTVIAVGNALGLFKNTVSAGIVSGLSRYISARPDPTGPAQELRGLIQTDAAINPGNSGGPLVDIEGKVIGINAAVISGAQNISFAIPIDTAKRDLADLQTYGRIRRPLLGLRYLILDEKLQKKYTLPVDHGAYVIKEGPSDYGVIPGSPADQAGVKEKDIVIACNGQKLTAEKTLQDHLDEYGVGDVIALTVMRKGKEMKIPVTLAERK